MVLIAWTDELAVNVKEIDDQHKKLINIINQLNDAMNSGKGRDVLGKVLTELVNYTMYHFGTEERLMEQHKYVNSPMHKDEHQKFVDTVGDFKKKFDSGNAMLSNEQPRSKLRGINPNLVDSFAASGGEFNPKRLRSCISCATGSPTTS